MNINIVVTAMSCFKSYRGRLLNFEEKIVHNLSSWRPFHANQTLVHNKVNNRCKLFVTPGVTIPLRIILSAGMRTLNKQELILCSCPLFNLLSLYITSNAF